MSDELREVLAGIGGISKGIDSLTATVSAQGKSIEELKEHYAEIDKRVKFVEQNPTERRVGSVGLPGLEDEKEKFSFIRAVSGICYGEWGRGFEKRVFQEGARIRNRAFSRQMSASDDNLGGYWVPPEALADFIPLLRARVVTEAAGATVMDGLTGAPVMIPKQTGGATAFWVGESATLTTSDLNAGQVRLEPHELGSAVKLSNRLIQMADPAAETIVRNDLSRVMALRLDLAALRGTGSDAQPLGVANTTGINTVAIGTDGGDFSLFIADQMRQELAVDNALFGTLGYITHPTVMGKLRRERIPQFSGQTDGNYVQPIASSDAAIRASLGFPFFETTQIPTNLTKGTLTTASEAYFANWEELLIGMWGGLDMLASPVAADGTSGAFLDNQTWVRAIMEVDVAVRHAESFCLVSDAATV